MVIFFSSLPSFTHPQQQQNLQLNVFLYFPEIDKCCFQQHFFYFIPGTNLKSSLQLLLALWVRYFIGFYCCLFCLSVQLCGETFGPARQFSEALARGDIDKNVNIGKRIHEG